MHRQDFEWLVKSGLLGDVEKIVVASHGADRRRRGLSWSPPDAYRWLRYEDADPVARLRGGVEKLRRRGAGFDAEAVDKACAKASKAGFWS